MDKPLILVVDDSPENLTLMAAMLKAEFQVKVAADGGNGLRIAASTPRPSLILLDVVMPEPDGYEVLRRLKEDPATSSIPVIFLTSRSEQDDEAEGLALGAADYIVKPASPPIVLARVRTQLKLREVSEFLRDKNDFLMQMVDRRTKELRTAQEVTIFALASLAETRDNDTGNHLWRTQGYVEVLARELRRVPAFQTGLTETLIDLIVKSAPLHDIGKVGIPDRVLLKPGKLDSAEFEIMKTHTTLGFEALERAEKGIGARLDFLKVAKEIVLSHQEKWDGSGYPQGLAGDAIPLSARLMAVADVYDALISRRVYKEGYPHERAVRIVLEGGGNHFDPAIIEVFARVADQFHEVARRYPDSADDLHSLEARRGP